MKKAAHILPFLLFSIYLAIPAVSLVNLATGYSIWIYSYHAYALLTAAISLAAAVNSFCEGCCINKDRKFMYSVYAINAAYKLDLLYNSCWMEVYGVVYAGLFYMCFSLYVTKYKASKEESNSIFILYNIFYSYMFYFAS